ncbi:hypothetical protein [Mesobacillus boroniphilus]|uniref:hypothetical protein n=1 Tax=Mesobacillus boroniphilus TaxID=308892 RepID=UPI000B28AFF3|nr:hypothetical protein [Mesobacillus boroniphilus]
MLLFGNLDEELISQNKKRVMEKSQQGDYLEVLLDSNGVGDLTNEGVEAFVALVKELQLMGLQRVLLELSRIMHFILIIQKQFRMFRS